MYRHRENITWRVLDEEAVILNTETGCYYTLNRTATQIWECVNTCVPVNDIVALVLQEYEVEEDKVRKDIKEQIENWLEESLICPAEVK